MTEYKDTKIGSKDVMFMYTISSYLPPNPIPYIYHVLYQYRGFYKTTYIS